MNDSKKMRLGISGSIGPDQKDHVFGSGCKKEFYTPYKEKKYLEQFKFCPYCDGEIITLPESEI